MDNLNKNPNSEQENEQLNSNPDDRVVFVPAEEIRIIEKVLNMMEQAQQEFCKAAMGMQPLSDLDLKVLELKMRGKA
jgi:hypothetical protein